jgi:hypothetical protein
MIQGGGMPERIHSGKFAGGKLWRDFSNLALENFCAVEFLTGTGKKRPK